MMKAFCVFACVTMLAWPAAAQTRKKPAESAESTRTTTTKSKKDVSAESSASNSEKKATTTKKASDATVSKTTGKSKTSATKIGEAATKSKPKSDTQKSESAETSSAKKKPSGSADSAKKPEPTKDTTKGEGATTGKKTGSGEESAATVKPDVSDKSKPTSEPVKPPQDNAGDDPVASKRKFGPNVTLAPEDLAEFDSQPESVQKLIRNGLALTERNLTYRYGSSDPASGGMDCSGTIYYLLKQAGIKEPPRDSSGIYLWTEKAGTLRAVNVKDLEDRALSDLKPGDLLFWEGTYEVQRDPPISHTMIYLGREKKTGTRVMVGASDGRTYAGISRNGVSVFDFRLPRAESTAKFVGYARVPGFDHSVRR